MRREIREFVEKKKSRRWWLAGVVAAGLLLIWPLWVGAKYVFDAAGTYYLDSKYFFFTSEDLNGRTHKLSTWDGVTDYVFAVDVSNAKDDLNWTRVDIPFTLAVDCSSNVGTVVCSYDGSTTLVASNENTTTNTITIAVNRNGLTFDADDEIEVRVTARSISPYSKELTSLFVVKANDMGLGYMVNDEVGGRYATLIISNSSVIDKTLNIDWDESKVEVDNNNYYVQQGTKTTAVIDGKTTVTNLQMTVLASNVYSIRFYKKDPQQNYNFNAGNLISITESGG